MWRVVGALLAALLPANSVLAQETSADPAEGARFHWGILRFTPSISVSDVGVDQNVFNEAVDPKSDTTAAVGPAAAYWIKLGRGRVSGNSVGQYLYFKKYENQRSWNTRNDARFEIPISRLKPFVGGHYSNTRERPGFEIDSRARRRDETVELGTDLKVSGKTTFVFSGMRTKSAYDPSETFLGARLAAVLDRQSDTEQLQVRHAMTPLTTFVVMADAIQDRFVTDTTRNADSIRVMPGFELKPFALISGKVFAGFRHFNVLNENTPDYDGFVALINASYVIAATKIDAQFNRDVTYSFETTTPYYALTDVAVTVTERITYKWDVVGRAGHQTLDYRATSNIGNVPERVDSGVMYGMGIGFRPGETMRLGFDVNYYHRDSSVVDYRDYDGLRFGASVSYGVPR